MKNIYTIHFWHGYHEPLAEKIIESLDVTEKTVTNDQGNEFKALEFNGSVDELMLCAPDVPVIVLPQAENSYSFNSQL